DPDLAVVDAAQHAVAVVLDLVEPVVALGSGFHQRGELWRNKKRHSCRPGFRPFYRFFLLRFDQEPVVLALLPFLRPHAHQVPGAMQPLALQYESHVPLAVAGARIALRPPHALVPDLHLARAVVPFRNHALELRVVERMVFDVLREALDAGVGARLVGNRPALQRAVEFQPEVVVQAARGVLLDDVAQFIRIAPLSAARLLRVPEVALLPVLRQSHARREARSGCLVLCRLCLSSETRSMTSADLRGAAVSFSGCSMVSVRPDFTFLRMRAMR